MQHPIPLPFVVIERGDGAGSGWRQFGLRACLNCAAPSERCRNSNDTAGLRASPPPSPSSLLCGCLLRTLQRHARRRAVEVGLIDEVLDRLEELLEDGALRQTSLKHGECECGGRGRGEGSRGGEKAGVGRRRVSRWRGEWECESSSSEAAKEKRAKSKKEAPSESDLNQLSNYLSF